MSETIIKGEPIYFAHSLNPEFKELLIVPLSDLHYGNPLCSIKHFRRTLGFIESAPNIYTIVNGDMIESATRLSKGDVYTQKETPMAQAKIVSDMLMPIKDRILGMTMGNHERRVYNEVGDDLSSYMAERLGVPYRAEGLLLKVSFGNENNRTEGRPYTYFIYATHGYGGARTKSAKAVKVERLSNWIHADVYVQSHDHVVNIAPDVYLIPDPRNHIDSDTGFRIGSVVAHRKMLVKTGAYIKWGGYSEALGFPPVDLVCPIIKLMGTGKPNVRVEI